MSSPRTSKTPIHYAGAAANGVRIGIDKGLALPVRGVVGAYRVLVSPLLPAACRFHPSCSAYADEALARHGFVRGSWLAARRLGRCHPWGAGGFDPVPGSVAGADVTPSLGSTEVSA